MTTRALSVVLAGGGTAGHVSPLLAIAGALREQNPETRILAVGTEAGMESRLVPAAGYELATIDRVPLPRKPSADLLRLPARMLRAVSQSAAILERSGADVLVGVGGYVCTPMYLAARRRGVPIVVHEANARPGLANRVGARLARRVAVAFAAAKLPGARLVGMPMRREISDLDRAAQRSGALKKLGLADDRPVLVVTGGSSGALSINTTVAASVASLAEAGIQVLHITGRGKRVLAPDGSPLAAPGYRQVEFVDGMEAVYAAADLLLARAGAATVCEVAAVGLPSVLVPLPHGNGEQALNASELVAAGGARLVSDAQFTPEWVTSNLIPLLTDREALQAMSRKAASLGIRDADRRMAQLVAEAVSA